MLLRFPFPFPFIVLSSSSQKLHLFEVSHLQESGYNSGNSAVPINWPSLLGKAVFLWQNLQMSHEPTNSSIKWPHRFLQDPLAGEISFWSVRSFHPHFVSTFKLLLHFLPSPAVENSHGCYRFWRLKDWCLQTLGVHLAFHTARHECPEEHMSSSSWLSIRHFSSAAASQILRAVQDSFKRFQSLALNYKLIWWTSFCVVNK